MDAHGGARAKPFVEKAGLTIPSLADRKGKLWERFAFQVVPVQLYFDETGRLVYQSKGSAEGEVLERLDEALKQPLKPAGERVAAASTQPASPERDAAALLFDQGVAALDAGDEGKALSLWKQALAKDPGNWLIRKQVWTLEAPEVFWGGDEIDYRWQKARMAEDREDG
jgi:hypothetical protein